MEIDSEATFRDKLKKNISETRNIDSSPFLFFLMKMTHFDLHYFSIILVLALLFLSF